MADSVNVNGFTNTVTTNNHITSRGAAWLYSVCGVMGATTFIILGLSLRKNPSQRLFHHITAAITLIATVTYFTMGSNLGWTAIQVEFERDDDKVAGNMRQIFYVRYIDMFLTNPLLLADLLLTAGLPTPTILYTILINEVMVVCALVGTLVKSTYKWGFFAFDCAALLFIAFVILWEGRAYARTLGTDISRIYTILGAWTVGLWLVYPIGWGVSEGGNVIAPDSEAVLYGVLDILSKPVFAAVLLWGHRNIDITRLGINIKDAAPAGAGVAEKEIEANPASATNGVTNESNAV